MAKNTKPKRERKAVPWDILLRASERGECHLSPRVKEYAELRANGLSYSDAREAMGIARRTLWHYQVACFEKYYDLVRTSGVEGKVVVANE